jgi:intracellular sulfur oxidation DsrE/DsrF family protein
MSYDRNDNIVSDYEKYGLTIGTDVDIVVIGYGAGARWLLTDTSFDTFFGTDAATVEANVALPVITSLITKGVKFFACQNTMINTKIPGTTTNIKTTDLTPEVNMVPAGVTALLDFQYLRYQYIAP